jgi:hypothetical protein
MAIFVIPMKINPYAESRYMYLRIHQTQGGKVVAACDEDLVGKILEDGRAYMDLDRYRAFYVGKIVGMKEVKEALHGFVSANLVGKDAVESAIEAGVASKDDILYIKKTPYIQIYNI